MMETPVSVSPFKMAWGMGAAPRQRGSRLAWTLIMPLKGIVGNCLNGSNEVYCLERSK
jgi:hypothetical protein